MTALEQLQNQIQILLASDDSRRHVSLELSSTQVPQLTSVLAFLMNAGDWLFLEGDLGSGKTHFTKHLFLSLGGEEDQVTSPTFTLLNTQTISQNDKIKKLIHLDLYRLKSDKELLFLGLEVEFQPNDSVCVFEWPYHVERDAFQNLFLLTKCSKPKRVLEMTIAFSQCAEARTYQFKKIFL
jgi:tRNA threonylcarbamoyladenosine biosynthesis protein TsaE